MQQRQLSESRRVLGEGYGDGSDSGQYLHSQLRVLLGAEGKAEMHFLGLLARHQGGELGMLFPETVFAEVKKLL